MTSNICGLSFFLRISCHILLKTVWKSRLIKFCSSFFIHFRQTIFKILYPLSTIANEISNVFFSRIRSDPLFRVWFCDITIK
ncbi:hypothetical protein Y032_1277g3801 [Ancylostoma ceylanicum]|uniref:Uncharacterized protein n=1 Tax=Ancylostoma ceylanicum TaxID=53326 RepID=A0A016W7D1_9BILA|nr:hypothetical protein Y032_1277g3801 [Ancylostoma ceylanicum]